MIEGLKIDVTTDELRAHCDERAAYHTKRADWYRSQVDTLNEGGEFQQSVTNNPVGSLNENRKRHESKAQFYVFVSKHLVSGEVYRLTDHDLGRLEITSQGY